MTDAFIAGKNCFWYSWKMIKFDRLKTIWLFVLTINVRLGYFILLSIDKNEVWNMNIN